MFISSHSSRRQLLGLGGALALIGLLPACGSDAGSPGQSAGSNADGPWEFTDDRGEKISLSQRPRIIVAQISAASALWDLGLRASAVFGPQRGSDGSPDRIVGSVDLGSVESVGADFGEFNLEKFASLKPDLVVTVMYGSTLWYVPEESTDKITQIAPIVGIQQAYKTVPEVIKRFEELAAALGANVNSPEISQARDGFTAASTALSAAVKEKQGLKTAFVIGEEEEFYVCDPAFHSDIKYFSGLGLDVVAPAAPDNGFESLSWEQADRYPADMLLEDARADGLTTEQLTKFPVWKTLPAVAAGQVRPWRSETPFSYAKFTGVLNELSEVVKTSRTDVVS